jgi:cell division protein ZapA
VSADERREKGVMTISLMGREFRVGCPEGEEKQLQASVDYLNRKLKEVRDTGKVVGNERIAIMAALNIAHERVSNDGKAGAETFDASAYRRRIVALQETLDSALAADQENLF